MFHLLFFSFLKLLFCFDCCHHSRIRYGRFSKFKTPKHKNHKNHKRNTESIVCACVFMPQRVSILNINTKFKMEKADNFFLYFNSFVYLNELYGFASLPTSQPARLRFAWIVACQFNSIHFISYSHSHQHIPFPFQLCTLFIFCSRLKKFAS